MNERTQNKNTPESPRRDVLKGFIGSLGTSLLVDMAHEKGRTPDNLDRLMSTRLHRHYEPHFAAANELDVNQYDDKYRQTLLWHGTGRYQYDEDSNKVDVLASICEQGALTPALDEFDVINGAILSTSLAKSRMYARAYADIHGCGTDEQNRYGSAGFWGTYVAAKLPFEAAIESKIWKKGSRQDIRNNLSKSNRRPWSAKAHSGFNSGDTGKAEHKGIFTPFYTGSDIEDNYPVLFGVKSLPVEAPVAKSIGRHEFRTEDKIMLDAISHVEVPYAKLAEARALLGSYELTMPVVAIETGEEYCSRLPFSSLVYPDK